MAKRDLFIVGTSLGRKLIRVEREEGEWTWVRKLRATSKAWTGVQKYRTEVLIEMGKRPPGDADRDLLRAATDADFKEERAAQIAKRLSR